MKSCHHATAFRLGIPRALSLQSRRARHQVNTTAALGNNGPDTGDIYSGLDRFGRVKDNRWYDYGSSVDVDRTKYGYDRASNRIWRQNVVANSLSQPFDELYHYDGVHRLKAMSRGTLNGSHDAISSKSLAECWSLDATGNWQKYLEDTNGDGTWDLNQARTFNDVNEITDITESVGTSWATPAYNRAGNMTTIPQPNDRVNSYAATYDAWNRLVKLVDGANMVAEYKYDGAKRRTIVKSYVSGSLDETRHAYFTDPAKWQVIEERVDSSNDAAQQCIWGLRYIDDLVLRDRDTIGNGTLDERLYSMQDANWNVTALVDTAGDVLQRFAYLPYGESLELDADFTAYSGNDLKWTVRFTGRELDLTTGLQINRDRYLHLSLGDWISRDSSNYNGSPWNLYRYAERKPIDLVDPSGEITPTIIIQAAVAPVGCGACLNYFYAIHGICANEQPPGQYDTDRLARCMEREIGSLGMITGASMSLACGICAWSAYTLIRFVINKMRPPTPKTPEIPKPCLCPPAVFYAVGCVGFACHFNAKTLTPPCVCCYWCTGTNGVRFYECIQVA